MGRTEIFLKLEQNLFSISNSNVELDHIFKFFHFLKFLYFVKIFFPKFLHIWKKFYKILTFFGKIFLRFWLPTNDGLKFRFFSYGQKSILPSVCSKKSNIFMFRTRTKTSNISNSNVERVRPTSPTSGRHGNLVSDELLNQLVKKKDGEKSKSKFIFKY